MKTQASDDASLGGLLEPFDRQLVARLARLGGEQDAGRLLLLALGVRAVREGHVCLSAALYGRLLGLDETAAAQAFLGLAASPLVARESARAAQTTTGCPFVLDDAQRLYLARYFDHQQALASRLVAVAQATIPAGAGPDPGLLAALFPPLPNGQIDLQRRAALHTCTAALTIISGGPGTGKSSTVVKVLALLVDGALRAGLRAPRTLLVAPTGKAAARLGESIRAALTRLPLSAQVREAIPCRASTLHRALGVHPAGGFRHGLERPLDADLVLVDEASMVDLALMRALLEAVRPGTRLVLLGDRDQLASVEAGSVLSDLCETAARPGSALSGCLQELVHSHRFGADSGIGGLSRAIRDQDAEGALAILRDPSVRDVRLEPALPTSGRLPTSLQDCARHGYAGLLALDPTAQLAALGSFRVLTAHRKGGLGVTLLGKRLAAAIGRKPDTQGHGTPLLVMENDPETRLWNGDVGVVNQTSGGHPSAFFEGDSGPRAVSLGRLPSHEQCWAMSIHKSQGSEFDVVVVVLPETSALASRELLYTAVTRARSQVLVHGSEASIIACIGRPVVRASGLVDALTARL